MTVKELIKKEIDKLPENLAAEVYDFVMFLESKKENNLWAQASQTLSAGSFLKIWDNEEDSIYENI